MKKKVLIGVPLLLTVFSAVNVLASAPQPGIPLLLLNGPPTVISAGGQIWMDRNLGASQVAASSIDTLAYGDLYQWGRLSDGHESRTSSTTLKLSSSDVPGHGSFILNETTTPIDWRTPQNDDLWQEGSGTNNPCPAGFRLPTVAEWDTERVSWVSIDVAGAFASPLNLVMAGYRNHNNGKFYNADSKGYYWSSTVTDIYVGYLVFNSASANINNTYRADGFSVRCLKD